MILTSAQFIMVLDSSVMNVSISQIVEDLKTTPSSRTSTPSCSTGSASTTRPR